VSDVLPDRRRARGAHAMTDEEKYQRLLEFVRTVAGDGYINTKGTAKMVLDEVGESRRPPISERVSP
jgi:hypothetical protein